MFGDKSQQSKTAVNVRNENIAGRIPETTRIVVHYNLLANLTEIRTSK